MRPGKAGSQPQAYTKQGTVNPGRNLVVQAQDLLWPKMSEPKTFILWWGETYPPSLFIWFQIIDILRQFSLLTVLHSGVVSWTVKFNVFGARKLHMWSVISAELGSLWDNPHFWCKLWVQDSHDHCQVLKFAGTHRTQSESCSAHGHALLQERGYNQLRERGMRQGPGNLHAQRLRCLSQWQWWSTILFLSTEYLKPCKY